MCVVVDVFVCVHACLRGCDVCLVGCVCWNVCLCMRCVDGVCLYMCG